MSTIFKGMHDEQAWVMFAAASLTRPMNMGQPGTPTARAAADADKMLEEYQKRVEATKAAPRDERR